MKQYIRFSHDFLAGLPTLSSLQILGDHIEGAVLTIEKKYWGGIEGSSKIQWFLVSAVCISIPNPESIQESAKIVLVIMKFLFLLFCLLAEKAKWT